LIAPTAAGKNLFFDRCPPDFIPGSRYSTRFDKPGGPLWASGHD
jgi:hypothetical protein